VDLQKVILYYGFSPLRDPDAIHLWQRTLCEGLGLKGRILLSPHGINGTLGGDMENLKKYIRQTKQYPGFRRIDFKWSDGTGEEFPRLRIRVRDEIVSFGAPGELIVDQRGVVGGGVHLTPGEINHLVDERGGDVVFFDARNAFEAKIGRFKNAVVPNVRTTRDFVTELDSGRYDHLKDKAVVTYCTGGIRCEVLSSVMRNRGFREVYQLEVVGGLALPVRRPDEPRVQRPGQGARHLRAMLRADQPVLQLRQPGLSKAHPAVRRVRHRQCREELPREPRARGGLRVSQNDPRPFETPKYTHVPG
jgi:predicted sulfurtransferase